MTRDSNVRLLRDMVRIRRVEETLADLYPSQEMRTPTHFSIGQEAVAVGLQSALNSPLDSVITGYRDHGHMLAYGIDPKIIDELRRRGHLVASPKTNSGGFQGILIEAKTNVLHGGSDPRKDGCAAGY